MINRFLAGTACVGVAAVYFAAMLANGRVLSVVEEMGPLASAVGFLGLACFQFSERARRWLYARFAIEP